MYIYLHSIKVLDGQPSVMSLLIKRSYITFVSYVFCVVKTIFKIEGFVITNNFIITDEEE